MMNASRISSYSGMQRIRIQIFSNTRNVSKYMATNYDPYNKGNDYANVMGVNALFTGSSSIKIYSSIPIEGSSVSLADEYWWVNIAGSLNTAVDIISNLFQIRPEITYADQYSGPNLYYRNIKLRDNLGKEIDYPTGVSYSDAYKQDGGFTTFHEFDIWGSGTIEISPVGRILYGVSNDAPIAPYHGFVWTGRMMLNWTESY